VYVRANKNVLDAEQLLELTQRLAHKHNLIEPQSLPKREITPIDFGELEIPLHQKVGFQTSDEIRSSILVKCGLIVTQGSSATSEKGPKHPLALFLDQLLTLTILPWILWCRISFLLRGFPNRCSNRLRNLRDL